MKNETKKTFFKFSQKIGLLMVIIGTGDMLRAHIIGSEWSLWIGIVATIGGSALWLRE